MTDLYETLDVPRDATPEAIKAAYRHKAKSQHPDAGGSAEAFQQLGVAHRVLSDEGRRRRYDETGEVDDAVDRTRANALQMIHQALAGFMNDDAAIYRDLVAEARNGISGQLASMQNKIAEIRRNVARAERLRKRFRAKTGPDFIGEMIEAQIVGARRGTTQIDEQIAVAKLALEMLVDAEFTAEPRSAQQTASRNIFGQSLGGVMPGRPVGW